MLLVGLLIPLFVGVLVAMESRTPTHDARVASQPLVESMTDVSDSHDALAKADRLDVAVRGGEAAAQPAPLEEYLSRLDVVGAGSSEPPMPIDRQRHGPKSNKVAIVARSNSKPRPIVAKTAIVKTATVKTATVKTSAVRAATVKTATIKAVAIRTAAIERTAIAERPKFARDTETCRLSAFGGLRKALNSVDCEI